MSQPIPMPVFGTQQANTTYLPRMAVYAVITNPHGQVALIHTGAEWSLPGGALLSSEVHLEALDRQMRVQLGAPGEILSLIAQADEFYFSPAENQHIHLQCNLYSASLKQADAAQPGAPLEWLSADEAAERLTLAAHAWAVRELYEW